MISNSSFVIISIFYTITNVFWMKLMKQKPERTMKMIITVRTNAKAIITGIS